MGSCNSKDKNKIKNKNKNKQEILIFLGSNSQFSIHRALLQYIVGLDLFSSPQFDLKIPELKEIPFFNKDLIQKQCTVLFIQKEIPQKIKEITRSVSRAKQIIFLTPQYNGATSPDIINTIQWINQYSLLKNENKRPFHNKQVAIISCSYISQNQINDVKILLSESQPKFFSQDFYVDLKTGQIDTQTRQISQNLKIRLSHWLQRFISKN